MSESEKYSFGVRFFLAFSIVSAVASIFGFFGKFWWVFETVSSFRVHFFLVLLTASLLFIWKKNYLKAAIFVAFAVSNLIFFVPYYLPQAECTNSGKLIRLASINVHTANKRFDLVRDYVASNSPEIVILTEVNQEWLLELKSLEKDYPLFVSQPRRDNFGIAMFSRIPCDRLEILNLAGEEIPSILMTFRIGSHSCTIVGTHPVPPRNYEYSFSRNRQLKLLGDFLHNVQGEKILMGDLNTTPWSPYFRELLDRSGLKDSSLGRGISVTWPVHAWWLFGIPIDHCLISHGLQVKNRKVGHPVGSDHYPILVDILFP